MSITCSMTAVFRQCGMTREQQEEFERMIPDVISYVEEKYGLSDVNVTGYGYPLSSGAFGLDCSYRLFDVGNDLRVVYVDERNRFYDNGQAEEIVDDFINKIYTPKITETQKKYNMKIQSDKISLNFLDVKPSYCAFHNKYNGDIEEFLKAENAVISLDCLIFMSDDKADYKTPMFEIKDFLNDCGEINKVDMFGCTPDFSEFYTKFRAENTSLSLNSLKDYFKSSPYSFCTYSVREKSRWFFYEKMTDESELESEWYEKKYIEFLPGVKIASAYSDFTFKENDIKIEKVFSKDKLSDILYEYEITENSTTSDTPNSEPIADNDPDTSENSVNRKCFPKTDAYKITFSDRLKKYISENDERYNFSEFGFKCYFVFDEFPKDTDVYEKHVFKLALDENGNAVQSNALTEITNPYRYRNNYKPSKYDGLEGHLYDDYICFYAKYYGK